MTFSFLNLQLKNCFPCLSSLMVVLKQWDQFHSLSLGHPVLSMCNHYYLQLQIDSKLVFFLVISPIFDTNSFKKKKNLLSSLGENFRACTFHLTLKNMEKSYTFLGVTQIRKSKVRSQKECWDVEFWLLLKPNLKARMSRQRGRLVVLEQKRYLVWIRKIQFSRKAIPSHHW